MELSMGAYVEKLNGKKRKIPISIVCEEDRQEQQFDALIKLWVNDKISYTALLDNYPEYDLSMADRILKRLYRIFRG